jgi:hypothetical protein
MLPAQTPVAKAKKAGRALERAAVKRQTDRATERFDPIFKKYTKRYFGVGTDWRCSRHREWPRAT